MLEAPLRPDQHVNHLEEEPLHRTPPRGGSAEACPELVVQPLDLLRCRARHVDSEPARDQQHSGEGSLHVPVLRAEAFVPAASL
eukprot:467658-Hanusia_phi.AAC.1